MAILVSVSSSKFASIGVLSWHHLDLQMTHFSQNE